MERQLIERKENPFFKREEIKIIVEAEKNPSFSEAEEAVASELKVEKEKILIRKIKGKFGRNTFLIEAEIYKNKEDKEEAGMKKKSDGKAKKAEPQQSTEEVKEDKKENKETEGGQ